MRESCLGGGVAGVGICGVIWSDGQPGRCPDRSSYAGRVLARIDKLLGHKAAAKMELEISNLPAA